MFSCSLSDFFYYSCFVQRGPLIKPSAAELNANVVDGNDSTCIRSSLVAALDTLDGKEAKVGRLFVVLSFSF